MNILHAFDLVTPSGTAFLVNDLCQAQANKGHKVMWLSSDYHLKASTIKPTNYEWLGLHCSVNLANFYYMPMLESWAKDNLKKFDVVHLHTARSYHNVILARYARKYDIPYIIDSHGSLPKWGVGLKPMLKSLYDVFNKDIVRADVVIAENEFGAMEYVNFGVSNEKIKVIMPPLDTKAYDVLPERGLFREKYGVDESIVMFLGRINKIKGLDFLVEGFRELLKTIPAKLIIVGSDDGYHGELELLLDHYKIWNEALFMGFLGGQDKLSALVDADVVVQVSYYEQGAYAPLEAVLCGTPIVVSDNSGAGVDIRYLEAGLICHWGDAKDLAEKMKIAISKPAFVMDMTKKAAQKIRKELSLDNQIEKYIKLYESLK